MLFSCLCHSLRSKEFKEKVRIHTKVMFEVVDLKLHYMTRSLVTILLGAKPAVGQTPARLYTRKCINLFKFPRKCFPHYVFVSLVLGSNNSFKVTNAFLPHVTFEPYELKIKLNFAWNREAYHGLLDAKRD